MKIQILFMIFLSSFLAAGCARFIVPEVGAIAHEESRIPYTADEKQDGVLGTKDLIFNYTISASDNGTGLTGELTFDRSLTDSFPIIKTFFLKINWLDGDGHVLKTVDITPLYGYSTSVPNKLKIDKQIETVSGSRFLNFNYYGVFRGEKPDVSEEWVIFLFPFSTP